MFASVLKSQVLFRVFGLLFLVGVVCFGLWLRTEFAPLLWMTGFVFSLFLLTPALLVMVQPDLAIVFINSVVYFFNQPRVDRYSGRVLNDGPRARLIKKDQWAKMSWGEKAVVYLIALAGLVLCLVVARYTYGLVLWRQAAAMVRSILP